MPDSAPLPALPMPRGVLHASMISASTMVFPLVVVVSIWGGQISKSIRPANDFPHDLVGAAVNPLRAGIDESPADRVIAHVTVAAVELQTFVGHLALQVGGPVFGHRRRLDIQLRFERYLHAILAEDARDSPSA